MTSLKNYGTRTLIGNWWEERVTLESYLPKYDRPRPVRDLTVDVHVRAKHENPKMFFDEPFQQETTYQFDTNPDRLEERSVLKSRGLKLESRRRLAGTNTMALESQPGSTKTPQLLSKQFHDPNKVRHKTVNQKAYNNPEFETTRGRLRSAETVKPRITALTESWDGPGWRK
jgi:hypothetical protein